MTDPLTYFNGITEKEFYTNRQARRAEYSGILEKYYDEIWEKNGVWHYGRLVEENHIYSDYVGNRTISPDDNYSVECYEERERLFLKKIKEQAFKDLDNNKIAVYIQLMSKLLQQLIKSIKSIDLEKDLKPYKEKVIAKLQTCISTIYESFQQEKPKSNATTIKKAPNIRWLADTKLLTTLFYELLKGQQKRRKGAISTRPIIQARILDLEKLLIENFTDKDGQPLNPETIHSYLKSNNTRNRVEEGGRIELEFEFL